MRLEFVRIEEANDLVNQLIEHHPQAIFLTDHDFKVKFYNHAFQKLTKRMKPNKAIVRIARKLLNRIRFVLKNKTAYEIAVVK